MGYHSALFFFLLLSSSIVSAEFILSAPPRENMAEAEKAYGPLAAELTRIIGTEVVFEAPESWAAYSYNMQNGKYDFVLDGPHFVAWRMAHTAHVPLVRLDGMLGYTVFAKKDGPDTLRELRFMKVCTMASPNLAAVVLLNQFDAYVAPTVVAPRGGVKGAFEAFEQGKCEAIALPSYFTERLPQEKVADLKKLFTSSEMPNLALTAGPRLSSQAQTAVINSLIDAKSRANLKPLLDRLAGTGNGILIPAKSVDYAGSEKLLEGVVWGW